MKILNRISRAASVLGLVGAFLAAGAGNSQADLALRIDYGNDGSFETEVHDNLAGDLLNLISGEIIHAESLGVVSGLVNTGWSKPAFGSSTVPILDLLTGMATTGETTIRIQLSDTDFDGSQPFGIGQLVHIGGTITILGETPPSGSYVKTSIFRDNNNVQFGTGAGTFICTTNEIYAGGFGEGDTFEGSCGNSVYLGNPYSITLETIIHLVDAGIVSYDANFRIAREGELDVPEPASIMLLGFGAMGLGAWRRRRKGEQN